jgi:hypothetical protein
MQAKNTTKTQVNHFKQDLLTSVVLTIVIFIIIAAFAIIQKP